MILADRVVGPSELAGSWTFEPGLVAALALTGVVYGRGLARLGRRSPSAARAGRAVAFYSGLAVLAVALMSPLEALAAALFSGHMVQHLLLMVVAAPLLVAARPTATLVAGLPAAGREMVHRAGAGGIRGAGRTLLNPVVVWIIGAVVLWAWHMPALYEAALTHDALHVLEHLSFLGAALLFWSVVLGSGARRGVPRPVAALLVFANGVQSSALGAVLLFAGSVLYPVHTAGSRAWDVTPLADQQLAGALMWGPPGILYVVTLGWLLVRWFAEMERPAQEALLVVTGEPA